MKVVWTDEAKVQLDGIYQYIQHDAPLYATQMVDKLTRRVDQLTDPPRSGRIVSKYNDENLRELIVHPYRPIYRLKPDRIDIIAVFHGAQQLPDAL